MPLVEALAASAARDHAPFYAPGHKQGQGAARQLQDLLGAALRADLPELPELDNLFAPAGPIAAAQELAAAAFGAEQTWFLANGSTCGIEAALLAVCAPGEKIIVPRNAHQSVISGLILAGAVPVFVMPDYDPDWDLVHGVSAAAVAAALEQHPDVRAVLLVSPTYHGVCSPVAAIATHAHAHNIPLLVDEAHGPHFGFHPDLPAAALRAGADIAVQSTHKVLGALTQASMLHVQGTRVDRGRLSRALQMTQSTSPSYLLLASLDAARQQMATVGQQRLGEVLAIATQIHRQLAALSPLALLTPSSAWPTIDATRLTLHVAPLGWSGFAADELFHETLGVTAELPALRHLTFILSLGNTPADAERLLAACQTLRRTAPSHPLESIQIGRPFPAAALALPPREAFFARSLALPIDQAAGRISAELVCPYPPGIPVLLPGEIITAEAIAYLTQVKQRRGRITGCSDAALSTLGVLA